MVLGHAPTTPSSPIEPALQKAPALPSSTPALPPQQNARSRLAPFMMALGLNGCGWLTGGMDIEPSDADIYCGLVSAATADIPSNLMLKRGPAIVAFQPDLTAGNLLVNVSGEWVLDPDLTRPIDFKGGMHFPATIDRGNDDDFKITQRKAGKSILTFVEVTLDFDYTDNDDKEHTLRPSGRFVLTSPDADGAAYTEVTLDQVLYAGSYFMGGPFTIQIEPLTDSDLPEKPVDKCLVHFGIDPDPPESTYTPPGDTASDTGIRPPEPPDMPSVEFNTDTGLPIPGAPPALQTPSIGVVTKTP